MAWRNLLESSQEYECTWPGFVGLVAAGGPSSVLVADIPDVHTPEPRRGHKEQNTLLWTVADRYDRSDNIVIAFSKGKRSAFDLSRVWGESRIAERLKYEVEQFLPFNFLRHVFILLFEESGSIMPYK